LLIEGDMRVLDRRSFLLASGAMLLPGPAHAEREQLELWLGVPPGGGGPDGEVRDVTDG
jgi:hypothetical protein